MTYPYSAGYKDEGVAKHNAELLDSLGVTAHNNRKVAFLYMRGFEGTATQAAEKMGMREVSVRPRCSQLYQQDLLKRVGETKNQWGKREYILAWKSQEEREQGDLFDVGS